MAAGTIVDGSRQLHKTNSGLLETVQIETGATGGTSVTYASRIGHIKGILVCSNEAGKYGPWAVAASGSTVTVSYADAAAAQDATIGLAISGY